MSDIRPVRKRWTFTINNYTPEDEKKIKTYISTEHVIYGIAGYESGKNGTKHLQGFVHLKKKVRLTAIKKLLSIRGHYEMARGTDKDNKLYCEKEGNLLVEAGEITDTGTEKGGGNTMVIKFKEFIQRKLSGETEEKILEENTMLRMWLHCRKSLKDFEDMKRVALSLEKTKEVYKTVIWREWQRDLLAYLSGEIHDRHIRWYVDEVGNTGKTFISKYLVTTGALRVENGKSADIKFAYCGQRVIIFDLSRTISDHMNYEVVESIKNGIVFSGKYESASKMFTIPHVIVFSNWHPDQTKLSQDRWNIIKL